MTIGLINSKLRELNLKRPATQICGYSYFKEDAIAMPIDIAMKFIYSQPYAHPWRLTFVIYFLSGCRPCEIDNMYWSNVFGNRLYWKPAKNQKGKARYVELPLNILKEFEHMRKHTKCDNHLFPYNAETFRGYFADIRRTLKLDQKLPCMKNGAVEFEYQFQLKGFRKLFSTKLFIEKWLYYGDAGISLEIVSKTLRHSSKHMTIYWYISEDFEYLGILKFLNVSMANILTMHNQQTLPLYNKDEKKEIKQRSEQTPLFAFST